MNKIRFNEKNEPVKNVTVIIKIDDVENKELTLNVKDFPYGFHTMESLQQSANRAETLTLQLEKAFMSALYEGADTQSIITPKSTSEDNNLPQTINQKKNTSKAKSTKKASSDILKKSSKNRKC